MSNTKVQKRISKYMFIGASIISLFFIIGLVTQGLWQRHQEVEKIQSQLLNSADSQANRILGTLLLPEERTALPMILDRIKSEEKLSNISLHQYGSSQESILDCTVCNGALDSTVKIKTLLKHGETTYGILEKTKSLDATGWLNLSQPQLWLFILGALSLSGVMLITLNMLQQELEEKSLKESLGEISRQVAHDLRSPLSLLKVVAAKSDHPVTESELNLARQAIERIEQISDSLLKQENTKREVYTYELSMMIESLIAAKRYEQENISFIFDNQLKEELQIQLDIAQTQRTISNLLDNAIEAIAHTGSVRLRLSQSSSEEIFIDIIDTGIGLKKLPTEGQSSKKRGHGLGVWAAKRSVKELKYESISGAGTAARIRLA